jgi:molybdopterin-binding protein
VEWTSLPFEVQVVEATKSTTTAHVTIDISGTVVTASTTNEAVERAPAQGARKTRER